MSLAGLALALTLSVSPRADGVEESPPPPNWILTVDPALAPLWTALEAEEHPDMNAGLAALLYFGWKLGGRALLVLIGGTISWEVQIFTRPTAALDLATARSESALGGLHVVPLPNGLALAGTF
jgi:hypothetical protein